MQLADDQAESGSAMAPTDTFAASALEPALAALRADRLVAFPSETVWGLAACARSEAAMAALRRWKGRDADQPVSVLVSSPAALEATGLRLEGLARRLAEQFWPGPLTLVLPGGAAFARGVARQDGAVGVRCSPHPVAAALVGAAERAGLGPLTATSLNRSGQSPARDLTSARALCAESGAPYLLVGSADAGGAAPTTVLDLTTHPARVLRPGGLDAQLRDAFGDRVDTRPAGGSDRAGVAPHTDGERDV